MISTNGGLGDLPRISPEMLVDLGTDCCGGGGVVPGTLDRDNDEALLATPRTGGIGDGSLSLGWCWDWGWCCCSGARVREGAAAFMVDQMLAMSALCSSDTVLAFQPLLLTTTSTRLPCNNCWACRFAGGKDGA